MVTVRQCSGGERYHRIASDPAVELTGPRLLSPAVDKLVESKGQTYYIIVHSSGVVRRSHIFKKLSTYKGAPSVKLVGARDPTIQGW